MKLLAMTLMLTAFLLSSCAPPPTPASKLSPGEQAIKQLEPQTGLRTVEAAAFSPDDRLVITGYKIVDAKGWFKDHHSLTVWDTRSDRVVRRFSGHQQNIRSVVSFVAFFPDGTKAISAGWDGTFKIWDIVRDREVLTFTGPERSVLHACLSRDGTRLLSAGEGDLLTPGRLRLWSVPDGTLVRTFDLPSSSIHSLTLSPDGRLALLGHAGSTQLPGGLRLMDLASGQVIRFLDSRQGWSLQAAFSLDGKSAVSVQSVGASHKPQFVIWDVASGNELYRLPTNAEVSSFLAFSGDAKRIYASAAEGRLFLLDVATGKEIWNIRVGRVVAVSADTKLALAEISPDSRGHRSEGATDLNLQIWDLIEAKAVRRLGVRER